MLNLEIQGNSPINAKILINGVDFSSNIDALDLTMRAGHIHRAHIDFLVDNIKVDAEALGMLHAIVDAGAAEEAATLDEIPSEDPTFVPITLRAGRDRDLDIKVLELVRPRYPTEAPDLFDAPSVIHPSKLASHAQLLAERLTQYGFIVHVTRTPGQDDPWHCQLEDYYEVLQEFQPRVAVCRGATMPEALCRAAIAAYGYRDPEDSPPDHAPQASK